MLPKKNRLNLKISKAGDFKVVGKSDEFTVKYKAGEKIKGAVVISKSVAKKAVDRNRTKRIILEALKNSGLLGEFIFIVRKNISDYKTQDINEQLAKIKSKING